VAAPAPGNKKAGRWPALSPYLVDDLNSRRTLLAAIQPAPLDETRLEILTSPECQQPPDDQPRNLQIFHTFSKMTGSQSAVKVESHSTERMSP